MLKNSKGGKYNFKKVAKYIALFLIALIIFFVSFPFVYKEKIEVDDLYSISTPVFWNKETYVNETLKDTVISNYKGDLSISSRSSDAEMVKILISRISKESVSTIKEDLQNYKSLYPKAKFSVKDMEVDDNEAVLLEITDTPNEIYSYQNILLVDVGEDSIYRVEGLVYHSVKPFESYYRLLVRNLIKSFSLE